MSTPEIRAASPRVGRAFRSRSVGRAVVCLVAALCVLPLSAGEGGACPSPEEMRARLERLGLERGSRTAKFDMPVPKDLLDKACKQIGKPFTMRDGDKGEGVIVAEVPVEAVWKALNDENRHAEEGSPVPVMYSEVIEGTPRGESRLIFQWTKKMGFGRWWVSHVWMNGELFETSKGKLWELRWEGQSDKADPEAYPMSTVSSDLKPVEFSEGAWLLVSLGESCTLIEYFNWTDPGGGMVGFTQPMVFTKGLRQTAAGMAELAEQYRSSTPSGPVFMLPDGTPLD